MRKRKRKIREQEAKRRVTDEGMIVDTSGGTSEEWTNRRYKQEDMWAFLPVKPKSDLLPEAISRDRAVDYFVDRKLEKAALSASPTASARDLIRRATYDLTGLPPTPAEVDAFVSSYADQPEKAWAALIDRLAG